MNPNADRLWTAPRWALAMLLACLGMLGPFSIDTYLPAFPGIAQTLSASPLQLQQTLSAYLFGFAFMNLFHGALADSFGRRPVILAGVAVFALASIGCALAASPAQLIGFRALQGLATGAGTVVSRAVIRDMFPPADAQRVMSQVTLFFGVAPAIAPLVGGVLFVHAGWRSIFWFLAAVGAALWLVNFRLLPETLEAAARQPFNLRNLMRGYASLLGNPRFVLLALASGVPFNGMFLYVLSAPAFLGELLQLAPTQFFWFFVINIAGIMGGAWVSGRLAGRIAPRRQVRWGYAIMAAVSAANVAANALFAANAAWAMLPIAIYSFGWALLTPVVTLMLLDVEPERRGLAASLQAVIGSVANGIVAGLLSPLVMHSALLLSVASLGLMSIGLAAWMVLGSRPAARRR
ncbi:MAG: multidrug effflux MFS transporter [Burkholderiales bacterium]|nr:multidrug effflux MFS transporter [Burkholderiales bacterium]